MSRRVLETPELSEVKGGVGRELYDPYPCDGQRRSKNGVVGLNGNHGRLEISPKRGPNGFTEFGKEKLFRETGEVGSDKGRGTEDVYERTCDLNLEQREHTMK